MTFEEIYTKAIDEIKQDPVSYVWNNYIKKHDDQEFIVITKPKMEDGKYPKYFLEFLYIALRIQLNPALFRTVRIIRLRLKLESVHYAVIIIFRVVKFEAFHIHIVR